MVQNIAKTEGISQTELDSILGTGQDNRVTKHDILAFLANKNKQKNTNPIPPQQASINIGSTDQIIEMDRMRRMIVNLIGRYLIAKIHGRCVSIIFPPRLFYP